MWIPGTSLVHVGDITLVALLALTRSTPLCIKQHALLGVPYIPLYPLYTTPVVITASSGVVAVVVAAVDETSQAEPR